MKTEDTEALRKQSAKLCKIKAGYSQPTCKNCSGTLCTFVHHSNSTLYCNTVYFSIFPFHQSNITSQVVNWRSDIILIIRVRVILRHSAYANLVY